MKRIVQEYSATILWNLVYNFSVNIINIILQVNVTTTSFDSSQTRRRAKLWRTQMEYDVQGRPTRSPKDTLKKGLNITAYNGVEWRMKSSNAALHCVGEMKMCTTNPDIEGDHTQDYTHQCSTIQGSVPQSNLSTKTTHRVIN